MIRVPNAMELLIVLGIGLGPFIYQSNFDHFLNTEYYGENFSFDYYNYLVITYQLISFSGIYFFLKLRDWEWNIFNVHSKSTLVVDGILLLILVFVLCKLCFFLLDEWAFISNDNADNVLLLKRSSWWSLILLIIVNSAYEELIVIGYICKKMERFPSFVVVIISVSLRALSHTYEGNNIWIVVIPIGIVFSYYFLKSKQLLPIIIAHGLFNLLISFHHK